MWVTSLFGLLGTAVTGLFGLKQKQGEAVVKGLSTFDAVVKADTDQVNSMSKAIEAVYQHGGVLERSWRPLFMYVCMGIIVARWFGYVPADLSPSEVEHVYTFAYLGMSGYVMRSLDKWMMGFQIGGIVKHFIEKKIL